MLPAVCRQMIRDYVGKRIKAPSLYMNNTEQIFLKVGALPHSTYCWHYTYSFFLLLLLIHFSRQPQSSGHYGGYCKQVYIHILAQRFMHTTTFLWSAYIFTCTLICHTSDTISNNHIQFTHTRSLPVSASSRTYLRNSFRDEFLILKGKVFHNLDPLYESEAFLKSVFGTGRSRLFHHCAIK